MHVTESHCCSLPQVLPTPVTVKAVGRAEVQIPRHPQRPAELAREVCRLRLLLLLRRLLLPLLLLVPRRCRLLQQMLSCGSPLQTGAYGVSDPCGAGASGWARGQWVVDHNNDQLNHWRHALA